MHTRPEPEQDFLHTWTGMSNQLTSQFGKVVVTGEMTAGSLFIKDTQATALSVQGRVSVVGPVTLGPTLIRGTDNSLLVQGGLGVSGRSFIDGGTDTVTIGGSASCLGFFGSTIGATKGPVGTLSSATDLQGTIDHLNTVIDVLKSYNLV